MYIEEVIQSNIVDFSGIPSNYYLLGLLSAFENRFQALADSQMKEIDTMPNFKAIVQFFRMAHPEWDESSDTVYRLYMYIRRKFRK